MEAERFAQVERIVEAALAHDGDVEEFVAAAAGGDEAIRTEVETLLAAYRDSETFLETPLELGQWAAEVASAENRDAPLDPGHLGPYRLERILGRGGMATVFLGRREDGEFDRQVAIKLLYPGLASESLLRRFRSERQILADLDHPNIARLYEGGTTPDGRPYLVMEHIAGRPIDRHCDAERLSIAERLTLFRKVCTAVSYAHRRLLVHRDIKPSNVLVTAAGEPKLLDFGIAKLLDPSKVAVTAEVTRTGLRPMSLAYASPEQIRGETLGTPSDVYSLGVLLFELLVGRRPGERSLTPSPAELAAAAPAPSSLVARGEGEGAFDSEVAPRRWTDPTALRSQLEGDLDTIVLKALRPEPEERYASVDDLSGDLERHLLGHPVQARPATVGYRLGKFVRRHRLAVSIAAANLLVLLGFVGAVTWQSFELRRERNAAVAEKDRAQAVNDLLVSLFEASSQEGVTSPDTTARELLDRGAQRAERELQERPDVLFTMLTTIGSVYNTIGLHQEAAPLLDRAIRLGESLHGESLELARVLTAAGYAYDALEQEDKAEALLRRGLAMKESQPEAVARDLSPSLRALALLLSETRGRHAEAVELLERAVRSLEGEPEPDPVELAGAYSALGLTLRHMADLDGAERAFRRSLDLSARQEQDGSRAIGLNNLALVLHDRGDLGEALLHYRQSLAIKETLNPDSMSLAATLHNVSLVALAVGSWDEAGALLSRAEPIIDNAMGPSNRYSALLLGTRSQLLLARGRPREAGRHAQAGLRMMEESLPEGHEWRDGARMLVVDAAYELGRFEEARQAAETALANQLAREEPSEEKLIRASSSLVRTHLALGRPEEASRVASDAETWARGAHERNPSDRTARRKLASLLNLRAHIRLATGEAGEPTAREALALLEPFALRSEVIAERWTYLESIVLVGDTDRALPIARDLLTKGYRERDFVALVRDRLGLEVATDR